MARSPALGGLEQGAVRLFGVLVCLAVVLPTLPRLGGVAGGIALVLAAGAAWLVWRWVPTSISGARQRRPVVAALWALGALLALLQVGRLSAFMDDPDRIWGSVVPDPVWLALLTLGAFRSPLAPPYVTISTLWLLTVLAGELRGRTSWVVGFVVAWLVIMGVPPLTGPTEFIVSLLGQLAGLAVCIWELRRPRTPQSDAAAPAPSVS